MNLTTPKSKVSSSSSSSAAAAAVETAEVEAKEKFDNKN
jgi:hypothetical protein